MAPWLLQGVDDLRDGGGLLADGHIDADHALALLVQDGVHGDERSCRSDGRR